MSFATRGVVTNGRGRVGRGRRGGIGRGRGRRAVVVTQEDVEEERVRLIQEKQSEVQRVLDRHDDLVRNAFRSVFCALNCVRSVNGFIWRNSYH